MEFEKEEAKEVISFRVEPELKQTMLEDAQQNGFRNLSEYLLELIKCNTDVVAKSILTENDIINLNENIKEELHKHHQLTLSEYEEYRTINYVMEKVKEALHKKYKAKMLIRRRVDFTSAEIVETIVKSLDVVLK